MNFYSLDGSKTNNNLINDAQIYENFNNTLNTNYNDENETFSGVPTTKSKATDKNYQCSDNYAVSGTTLGNIINNTTIDNCKKQCFDSNNNCVGFNFDVSNNTCVLKQNATSLMNSAPSNTLCIKKSAGNKNCNVTKPNNESAFNELNAIFENSPEQIKDKLQYTMNNPTHKQLEEMIKNYYNLPTDEKQLLLNNLSNVSKVPQEIITKNIPNLIHFVNVEDTPNYNVIAAVKQIAMMQQDANPNEHVLTTPSTLPIPSESEISLTTMISKFSNLTQQQQAQLINTISNYAGVTPNYVQQDIGKIVHAIQDENIGNIGIYNKIKTLDDALDEKQVVNSYPLDIPKAEIKVENLMESEMELREKIEKMRTDHEGIFVDLNCFMNNIEVLKHHTDNMMIDLSILLSNVKSCSYVKKHHKYKEDVLDRIKIPTPDVVRLQNMRSITTIPHADLTTHGQVLGIIKEPFESETIYKKGFWTTWEIITIVVVILIIIIILVREFL